VPRFKTYSKHIFTKKVAQPSPFTDVPKQKTSPNFVRSSCNVDILEKISFLIRSHMKAATNVDIAANIIGFIRQAALGDPLKPYDQRVDEAVSQISASRDWSRPQQQWLQRIASQMKKEIVVDKDALNKAQFREMGGFNRLNKIFNGELSQILENMTDLVWQMQA
jgi:type I site-specific restriction endonuclease